MLPIENPADEARSAVRSTSAMPSSALPAPARDDEDTITPDPFLEAVARIPTVPSAPPPPGTDRG